MRSILFWWLLATMDREWWARFLDRYGSPFLLGTYPRGDADSRSVMERAFALAVKLGGLVVSADTKVELSQAAATASRPAAQRTEAGRRPDGAAAAAFLAPGGVVVHPQANETVRADDGSLQAKIDGGSAYCTLHLVPPMTVHGNQVAVPGAIDSSSISWMPTIVSAPLTDASSISVQP
jgi:hypothetical protein